MIAYQLIFRTIVIILLQATAETLAVNVAGLAIYLHVSYEFTNLNTTPLQTILKALILSQLPCHTYSMPF